MTSKAEEEMYFQEDMEHLDTYIYAHYAWKTMAPLGVQKDALHMAMGMVTEAGELMDVFKKNLAYGKEIDWVNVKEEVGDLMWYIINMCNVKGWDINDIMRRNIRKLRIRYPDNFTEEAANNRNLSDERKALED